ncbi:ABC transporter permease [Pseudonocardia humida]|uniref:ABC transporter permease n=1 Tax=Pseudonocardia humida TaxID=2800819 RepID=A0ABT1A2A5_9PSEU|nr:ABC transporter permease [Pseudonocardia humida]MCO1657130.1 ABC transporter permease [Pseudonocardia humida]
MTNTQTITSPGTTTPDTRELTDLVREQAQRLGCWPSGRQVIAEFRVGRPKANAVLAALRESGFDPTTSAATQDTLALDVVPVRPYKPTPSASGAVGGWTAEQISSPDRRPSETERPAAEVRRPRLGSWPLVLIALGAFVSIWGGWVGLGELTGFGPIRLLPGIADNVVIDSAITLPIGVEAYAAFALRTWLAPDTGLSAAARRFARWPAIGSLALGAAGQIAYHLMVAAGVREAPWPITAFVSCLPVVVLGCAAALTHLIHRFDDTLGVQR